VVDVVKSFFVSHVEEIGFRLIMMAFDLLIYN